MPVWAPHRQASPPTSTGHGRVPGCNCRQQRGSGKGGCHCSQRAAPTATWRSAAGGRRRRAAGPSWRGGGCEPGPEAPCAPACPLPTARAPTPCTHTGPFFSKPCRWAAQEARAAKMYRKTLIYQGRGIIRGQTASTPAHGGPAVAPFLKGILRAHAACWPPACFLAPTETAKATGPAKLQMSVS